MWRCARRAMRGMPRVESPRPEDPFEEKTDGFLGVGIDPVEILRDQDEGPPAALWRALRMSGRVPTRRAARRGMVTCDAARSEGDRSSEMAAGLASQAGRRGQRAPARDRCRGPTLACSLRRAQGGRARRLSPAAD